MNSKKFRILIFVFSACLILLGSNKNGNGPQTGRTKSAAQPLKPAEQHLSNSNLMEEGVLIVKLKQKLTFAKSASSTPWASLNKVSTKHGVHRITRLAPFLEGSKKKGVEEIEKIHFFYFGSGENPYDVAEEFLADAAVEFAEPLYKTRILDTPNDPLFGTQLSQMTQIRIPEAWDVVKCDTSNVVIAVVDGGTDWEHEDLSANIWINPGEIAGNNIDDDNNGFIDDIRGWNFATNTNNPKGRASQPLVASHGTETAGVIGAVANNAAGIAGASWNCTIMPINVALQNANQDSVLGFGIQGVLYAIENNADIVNTSFGGPGNGNIWQEIADFGLENETLIISSAGNESNNNDETDSFPANAKGVLSVGSIGDSNIKSGFSNYGVSVDVYANGENVPTSTPDNGYGRSSGTSFSAPYVSAVAGLVKARFPHFTAVEVSEQIRTTATSIESGNLNKFKGLLGRGKVDAFLAVTDTTRPSLRLLNATTTLSGEDNVGSTGDTITVTANFTNYRADAANIDFTISSKDERIQTVDAQATLGALAKNERAEVTFKVAITGDFEPSETLNLFIDFAGANHAGREMFSTIPNPAQQLTQGTGPVSTTITAEGNIGYISTASDLNGTGFMLDGKNMLYEGGLLIATGPENVSDCVRGADQAIQETDFKPATDAILKINSPGIKAAQEGSVSLTDSSAKSPIGLSIYQESFAYDQDDFNSFIIVKYTITNNNATALRDMHVGLFFDWDITENGGEDFARYDAFHHMGIAQNAGTNPTRIGATKLLSIEGKTNFQAIHNSNEIYDGFTEGEKWQKMSGGIQARSVDNTDVSTLTSAGPFRVEAGETIEVGFAIIGSQSLSQLQASANAAQYLWENELSPTINTIAPALSVSLFQNPAASRYADAIVIVDRSLNEMPVISLATAGQSSTDIPAAPLLNSRRMYTGALKFETPGQYTMETTARAAYTKAETRTERTLQVVLAKPGKQTLLTLDGGRAAVTIDDEQVDEPTYIVGHIDSIEHEQIANFSPPVKFNRKQVLKMSLPTNIHGTVSSWTIYQETDASWVPLETKIDSQTKQAVAMIQELGRYKLAGDPHGTPNEIIPTSYALKQNFPNPFNPSTTIRFDIKNRSQVKLTIFNALGQVIKNLLDETREPGTYQVTWTGRDSRNNTVPSGVYFYKISAGTFSKTHKMILIR